MDDVRKHSNCNAVIWTSEDTCLNLRSRPSYTILVCCLLSLPLWLILTPHAVKLIIKCTIPKLKREISISRDVGTTRGAARMRVLKFSFALLVSVLPFCLTRSTSSTAHGTSRQPYTLKHSSETPATQSLELISSLMENCVCSTR